MTHLEFDDGVQKWPRELSRIWQSSTGIEAVVGAALYLIWPLLLSFHIQRVLSRSFGCRSSVTIEVYVIACLAITISFWYAMPAFWPAIICSYISLSTVTVLLHVVFLSKLLGGVQSVERSLILFICNVTQVVFMFSIWYEFETGLPRDTALVSSLMVLGTLGYPTNVNVVVGIQIATDLLLFMVFLAHLVGRVGLPSVKGAHDGGESHGAP